MDRLTLLFVVFAVVLLAALPLLERRNMAPAAGQESEPSPAEDLRTGKLTREEYEAAEREERP